jgi:hypothetical protein
MIEFDARSTYVGPSASACFGEDAQNPVELLMQSRGFVRRHMADIPEPERVSEEFGRVVVVDRDLLFVLLIPGVARRLLGRGVLTVL